MYNHDDVLIKKSTNSTFILTYEGRSKSIGEEII